MKNANVIEKIGSVPPADFSRWESARRQAGTSQLDRAKPVSCQYKNNSDKISKNCTVNHGYIKTSGDKKHGEKPSEEAPVSVVACHNQAWTIRLWKKEDVTDQVHVPFTCRSWRHAGPCREFKGCQDFARIKEGLEKFDGWVYLTLTYAHRRKNVSAVYKKIADQCENLRVAIARKFCRPGEKLKYIALIEQHKDGYPHINLLVHSEDFVAAANKDYKAVRRVLGKHVRGTGFGKFWLEPMRNSEAMAGYFSKLCGEVAKTSQAPMAAPKNFRRLRSSHDLLPPTRKSGEYTGELVQSEVEQASAHLFPIRYLENEKAAGNEICNKESRAILQYELGEAGAGKYLVSILNARFHNISSLGDCFIPRPMSDSQKIA